MGAGPRPRVPPRREPPGTVRRNVPTDSEVKLLLESAQATRKRPSRGMWIVAIVVSVVCVGAFAYAMISDWNEPASERVERRPTSTGSGFGLGFMIGIAAGIAIGSLLAVRKRQA